MNSTYGNFQEPSTLTYQTMLDAMTKIKALQLPKLPIRIIENMFLTEIIQYRFPKKKNNYRWVKKFKKRYVKEIPSTKGYLFKDSNTLVCHPMMVNEILAQNKKNTLIIK